MLLYAVCEPWLKWLEVWPLKRFGWKLLVYIMGSVLYLLLPEIVYLYKNYKDVELFGSCFCEMMVVCQGLYKLAILMYHKGNWKIVITDICNIFNDYAHFTEKEQKWIERLQFFIEIYIKMFFVTGIVYITSPNWFAFAQYGMGHQNVTLLPETAKIDLIFVDPKETAIGYAIYTILNLSTVTYISMVCGTTDILYLTTIYFGIFYLQRITKRLSKQELTFENLRDFAINHKQIILIFKRVQKLSKTFMLIMYFSNLSMTCFIGLVLTTVPQTTNSLINFTMFLGTVQAQMLAYSFIGEMLLNCSSDVIRMLWNTNWYEQPVEIQDRMVKFIMMQAQNNKIALSASSVLNVSYESYLKYVKTSFQILCLLQSFYV